MKRRVTSPNWAPPLPCKQALIKQNIKFARASRFFVHIVVVITRLRHESVHFQVSWFLQNLGKRRGWGDQGLFKDKNHFFKDFFPPYFNIE